MKETAVLSMFDRISARYDFLNRFLSLGRDVYWRSQVAQFVKSRQPKKVLDVATGTADLAIAVARVCPDAQIEGVDVSSGMLALGQDKCDRIGLPIVLRQASVSELPYADESFDVVTAAFGVRNFEDKMRGLKQMHRVLKPKGTCVILEFALPEGWILPLYLFYFRRVLPVLGGWLSKDKQAYRYLNTSVEQFDNPAQFKAALKNAGFQEPRSVPMTFGVVQMYVGVKRA